MLERKVLSPAAIGVETERKSSVGVALVIVGIDPSRNGENATQPKLWTIKEKKSKPETERIAGQISFPGETRKKGESFNSNIVGSLVEFSDDVRLIGNNLFFVNGSSMIQGLVTVRSNPFDLFVIVYEGPLNHPINPLDKDEVIPNGWMSLDEIQRENPRMIRSFVQQVIEKERSTGVISKVIFEYFHSPLKRAPLSLLIPAGFSSIGQFYTEREKLLDVVR